MPELKPETLERIKKITSSPKFNTLADKTKSRLTNLLAQVEQSQPKKSVGEKIKTAYEQYQQLPVIKQGDQIVNKVADIVQPKVQAGTTNLELAAKLPQQMAAEFIRSYKPSDLLAFFGAAKLVKPVLKPVAKAAWKATPQVAKDFLLKEMTVGRGLPEEYLAMLRKAKLEKSAGIREAEDVGKVLTTAPKDMKIVTPKGNDIVVKAGQPITQEHQRYIGRIFRKEIDLGGKKSGIVQSPDISRRIATNVEVEVAFNPKLKALNDELAEVNKAISNKELQATNLIGKEFRTDTGSIEKATGVSKTPKINPSGNPSTKRFDVGVKTESVSPNLPTTSPIAANLLNEGEDVVRGIKQVSGSSTTNEFINTERKLLLKKRKQLSDQLMKETIKLEENVKANYYVFNRDYTEQLRTHPKYQELSEIANKGRDVMDKWSKALIDSGIPKKDAEEAIKANIGSYMARMYEKHLVAGKTNYSSKNIRLRLEGLKHRKNLSEEVRKAMGEVETPGLPTARRVLGISKTIANNKVFNAVADNPEWVATSNLTGTMVQMPKSDLLGKLSGKFVVADIANDINAITSLKLQNKALELYGKGLNAWKYGKVVLNPATHFRNMLTNTMLLDLSGVNHFRQLQLMPKVIKDYLAKGPIYQQALKTGAVGDEFVGGEVALIEKFYNAGQGGNVDKWSNVLKAPLRKFGDVYKAEEQIAKMIKFADEIEKGKSPAIAALESQKWLFNYQEIPNAIKVAKQISPFITFTYKSVPRVAEAIVNNPIKVYKYYALANSMNESSRKMLNMTPADYAREQKALPPWLLRSIGGIPANILMPWKDKYGRTEWLNLEYLLPTGVVPEIAENGILNVVGNPIMTLYASLSSNRDFKGQDIVPVGATRVEAAKIVTEYIYRQLAPTLAPGLTNLENGESLFKGGYSFEKIMNSIYQKPDFADRTREITPVIFDVLMGLKLTPLDVNEGERFNMFKKKSMIEDLNNQAMKLNSPAVSQEVREKETEKLFQKIQKVLTE